MFNGVYSLGSAPVFSSPSIAESSSRLSEWEQPDEAIYPLYLKTIINKNKIHFEFLISGSVECKLWLLYIPVYNNNVVN